MAKFISPGTLGRLDPGQYKTLPDHYTSCLWPAALPSRPKDYGDNQFHGRTHPEIILVAGERYTKPGDWVWDPTAGSGTTLDVGKELGLNVIATDINSSRADILKGDVRLYNPGREVDLIIYHPPYMDIVDYGPEGGLCTGDLLAYRAESHAAIFNMTKYLKAGHVLVAILGMVYAETGAYKQSVCLDMELWPYFSQSYRLLGRIMRHYGETKGGESSNAKNRALWKYRRIKFGLWSLGYDVVLFLQKVG